MYTNEHDEGGIGFEEEDTKIDDEANNGQRKIVVEQIETSGAVNETFHISNVRCHLSF